MKFDPLPEERNSPQLIEHLKEIYKMRAEDRESLVRIEAQVAARMRSRLMKQPLPEHQESHPWQPPNSEHVPHHERLDQMDRPGDWNPLTRPAERDAIDRGRPKTHWRSHLNLIAAVIVVVLMSGSAAAIFTALQHRHTVIRHATGPANSSVP